MVVSLPILTIWSFQFDNWMSFLPLIYAFGLIPSLELFFKPDPKNLDAAEEEIAKVDKAYDLVIYAMLPIQFVVLYLFLGHINTHSMGIGMIGHIVAMGIMCGVFGINIAHELGHRSKAYEQLMAKILLLTSLYMHFFIEHNRGHHKHVATEQDPASARFGESIITFWFRSIIGSYRSAWRIEKQSLSKAGKPFLSVQNGMLVYQFIQMAFVAIIVLFFGPQSAIAFILAAILGILLLETVNYIEHYGLSRKYKDSTFESPKPWHSWNSNHILGRLLLFELSRHSDHHYRASRKYQILKSHENSPQMPTGYPGMMILSLVPPLWFYVMHRHIKKEQERLSLIN